MLFRPHSPKYIFGRQVPLTPGLIPKERARLATKMAEAISTRLLTPEVLAAELANTEMWPLPDISVGQALANFGVGLDSMSNFIKLLDRPLPPALDAKLQELTFAIIDESVGSLAKMFISKEKIYAGIKQNVYEYLQNPENHELLQTQLQNSGILDVNIHETFSRVWQEKGGRILEIAASYIAKNIPVAAMIENKLAGFDAQEAEETILKVAGREMRLIIWLGGILGFIMGSIMIII